MKLYELKRGDKFLLVDEIHLPPGCDPPVEDLGLLTYLKMDGMYAQVKAEDPEIHQKMADGYDLGCPFFCLVAWTEVEKTDA